MEEEGDDHMAERWHASDSIRVRVMRADTAMSTTSPAASGFLSVSPHATIREFILLLTDRFDLHDRRIRLIFKGRQLKQMDATLQSVGVEDLSCVHMVVSDDLSHTSSSTSTSSSSSSVHSPSSSPSSSSSYVHNGTYAPPRDIEMGQPQLRGFDRLRHYGFSVAEVEEYRQQFHASVIRSVNSGNRRALDQYLTILNAGRLQELEDMWIDTLIRDQNVSDDRADAVRLQQSTDEFIEMDSEEDRGANAEVQQQTQRAMYINDRTMETEEEENERQGPYNDAVTSDGSLRDMFFGMVLGFLLSFTILFFWALDPHTSRRYKFGIVAGVVCNVALGFIHFARSVG